LAELDHFTGITDHQILAALLTPGGTQMQAQAHSRAHVLYVAIIIKSSQNKYSRTASEVLHSTSPNTSKAFELLPRIISIKNTALHKLLDKVDQANVQHHLASLSYIYTTSSIPQQKTKKTNSDVPKKACYATRQKGSQSEHAEVDKTVAPTQVRAHPKVSTPSSSSPSSSRKRVLPAQR
jgi:hypothetical protein